MTYEEKRELRLQISQLLADAGLNQGTIKEMVHDTINKKVDRAVRQCIENLNAQSSTGNYMEEYINEKLRNDYWTQRYIEEAVYNCIKEKILKISLEEK